VQKKRKVNPEYLRADWREMTWEELEALFLLELVQMEEEARRRLRQKEPPGPASSPPAPPSSPRPT